MSRSLTQRNKLKRELFAQQLGLCHLCGRPMSLVLNIDDGRVPRRAATFEHIVAKADGGGSDRANLALSHRLCNVRRGTLSVEGARRLMGYETTTPPEGLGNPGQNSPTAAHR